jgi:hypothetical protein
MSNAYPVNRFPRSRTLSKKNLDRLVDTTEDLRKSVVSTSDKQRHVRRDITVRITGFNTDDGSYTAKRQQIVKHKAEDILDTQLFEWQDSIDDTSEYKIYPDDTFFCNNCISRFNGMITDDDGKNHPLYTIPSANAIRIYYTDEISSNTSAEIPANSFAQIIGYDDKNHAIKVVKPLMTGCDPSRVVFVPSAIKKGKYGVGLRGGLQQISFANKSSGIGYRRVGQTCGTCSDSFTPYYVWTGFPIVIADSANKYIVIDMDHVQTIKLFRVMGDADSNGCYTAVPSTMVSSYIKPTDQVKLKFESIRGTYPSYTYLTNMYPAILIGADANYDYWSVIQTDPRYYLLDSVQ